MIRLEPRKNEKRGERFRGEREPGLAGVWGVQSWGSAKGFPLEVRGFTGGCAGWKWDPSSSVGALLLWAELRNSSKVQLCCAEVNCSVCVYSGTNCPRLRKRKALLGHNKYFLHLWFVGRSLVQMRHFSKDPASLTWKAAKVATTWKINKWNATYVGVTT